LIEIINKQLLLQLVGYLCYWQMGFNSVFKGLRISGSIPLFPYMSLCEAYPFWSTTGSMYSIFVVHGS